MMDIVQVDPANSLTRQPVLHGCGAGWSRLQSYAINQPKRYRQRNFA